MMCLAYSKVQPHSRGIHNVILQVTRGFAILIKMAPTRLVVLNLYESKLLTWAIHPIDLRLRYHLL